LFAIRDPKVHTQRRKIFARPFSKTELRRSWEGVVRGKVRLAVERIRAEAAKKTG
jgi:cytochrome P450